MQELLELLHEAGHSDFRDARGPMGFTQRQAGGKFTADEAEGFIEQLQAEAHEGTPPSPAAAKPSPRLTAAEKAVGEISDAVLAAELQRRGWIVVEP